MALLAMNTNKVNRNHTSKHLYADNGVVKGGKCIVCGCDCNTKTALANQPIVYIHSDCISNRPIENIKKVTAYGNYKRIRIEFDLLAFSKNALQSKAMLYTYGFISKDNKHFISDNYGSLSRFGKFGSSLQEYKLNGLRISNLVIIITDENGNDLRKVNYTFTNSDNFSKDLHNLMVTTL